MRKIKIFGLVLFLAFAFLPLGEVKAVELSCIKSQNCIETSASCARLIGEVLSSGDLKLEVNGGNGASDYATVKIDDLNDLDKAVLKTSDTLKYMKEPNLLVYLCQFSDISKLSGVTDTDKKAVCLQYQNVVTTVSGTGIKMDSTGAFYQCIFGDTQAKMKTVKELYICPTGKTCNNEKVTAPTTTTTSTTGSTLSATASKADLPALTAGTCNIDCTPAGFFKNVSKDCLCCGTCSPDDLLTVANTALEWLFGIVGALGLAMFVYGGFRWVTSAGESGSISTGKKAMVNTAIGLAIMFSSGIVIVTLQKAIGVDSSKQVELTGKVTVTSSSSSSSSETATAKTGDKKLGEACSVLPGQDTQCVEGNYCKALQTGGSVGVCIPKTIQSTLEPGADCYYMPNKDNPSLCKSGHCQVSSSTNPDVGTKGTCPPAIQYGSSCNSDTDCGDIGVCVTNICIPKTGRNIQRFEDCYVLKGSTTNDCDGALRCIPNISTWNYGDSRTAGQAGQCDYIKEIATGAQCSRDFECQSLKCDQSVERCVTESFSYGKTLGQGCTTLTAYETGTSFSDCVSGLVCSASNHVCENP